MKFTNYSFKNFSSSVVNFLWILGIHAFAVILFLIFVDFLLGGIVFYNYVFSAEQRAPDAKNNVIKFNDKLYQSVLLNLQNNGQESNTQTNSQ